MIFKNSGNLLSSSIAFGWVNPGGLTFPMHDHDYFEVSIMLQGRIWHLIKDSSYILNRCDVIFIRPWDFHDFKMVNGEDFLFLNIPFSGGVLDAFAALMEETHTIKKLLDMPEPPRGRIDVMEVCRIEKMKEEMDNVQRMRRSLYMTLMRTLNDAFFSQQSDQIDHGPTWFQRLLMEMMMENNLRGGLPRLYALCNRTPEHISRTFKRYLNLTPTTYINSLRIDKACEKLKHTRQSILDIAYSLGFDSASYFYRVFHEFVGMTPMQYRGNSQHASRMEKMDTCQK